MSDYVTTNLRMPQPMMRALKLKAINEHKRVSQLIREAVEQYLHFIPQIPKDPRVQEDDPILGIIGTCNTGITDGSVNHDFYLYGAPRRQPLKEDRKPKR